MPYLRVTGAPLPAERKAEVARQLTEAVNPLFFSPRGGPTRGELRERTTIHFAEYRDEDLYIGGRTTGQRGRVDLNVELSDWNMSARKQRRVARHLTPVLARPFGVGPGDVDGINLRFHPYPPRDFAVGGRLLSDQVPWTHQFFKARGG